MRRDRFVSSRDEINDPRSPYPCTCGLSRYQSGDAHSTFIPLHSRTQNPKPHHPKNYKSMDPTTASTLPPEAIALASRMYDAARAGQMDIFEQALPAGLPANMTNEKGDSLVSYMSQLILTSIDTSFFTDACLSISRAAHLFED